MAHAHGAGVLRTSVNATSETIAVDVIVPVYRGLSPTRRCIQSLLSALQATPYEFVLVNDRSPEPELEVFLASLRGLPHVTLLENKDNLGFVASVNLGMSLHPDRDVVLLNSDTEVANDWLDRLRACALSRREIATATPFSNNATICSYPDFCRENELPHGVGLGDLDRIFRRVNAGRVIEIPTAIGFCMYIKRACLDDVGLFDAERFGKGYGEENDFSMRAAEKGWSNVLCADTFVFHQGGASFQAEKTGLQSRAGEVLRALHPDYEEKVHRFILHDPLKELRQAIDIELAMERRPKQSERRVRPDMASAIRNSMKTIVCVNVRADTTRSAAETVRCLASGSLTCVGIFVAGDSGESSDKGALVAAAGEIPLAFVSSGECLSALKNNLRDTGAAGVFLVSAGMVVPYAFDVRLAKIAMQDASVGTVSPFCDISSVHRLRELPVADELQTQDASRLDRLAFLLGRKTYFEVPECLFECCFIPATAIERLAQPKGGPNGGALAWLGQSSEPGSIHVLSDSVYVGKLPAAAIATRIKSAHTDSPELAHSRKTILEAYQAGVDFKAAPGLDGRPVQLHVIHDLGGGSATWLKDYCLADSRRINLVLRSFTHSNAAGCGVALYSHVMDEVPLRVWKFADEIQATVVTHLEYRSALNEIIRECCVDVVLVSSLIGHSLDVLNTGLPTVVVNHDYFPYCPALNIFFGAVCRQCDENRIGECYRDNPKFNPFVTFLPRERVLVRDRFLELAGHPNVTMATPSRSVEDNLVRLDARFGQASFVTIPHGYGQSLKKLDDRKPGAQDRLRILVLGQLSVLKGSELFGESLGGLTEFAEVFLVGCRELGELFKHHPGVHVVSNYEPDHLPGHLASINPHVGLLMSICPETFSYALTELMMLGVPVAATRVGSFPERIRHLETGYLYEPDAASLIGALRAVDADRETLSRIRENLRGWEPRSAEAMVSDYHRIAPIEAGAYARYPAAPAFRGAQSAIRTAPDETWPPQAMTISSMWKEVKRLHLQLSMSTEGGLRADRHRQNTERHYIREQHEFQRLIAESSAVIANREALLAEKDGLIQALTSQNQTLASQNQALISQDQAVNSQNQALNSQNQVLTSQIQALTSQDQALTSQVQSLTSQVQSLTTLVNARDAQLAEILSSTSWRVSCPVRVLGRTLRGLRFLGHCLMPSLRNPASLPENAVTLFRAWRLGGLPEFKRALPYVYAAAGSQDAWMEYRRTFNREVRPRIIRRIREMATQPRVSIIVPTHDTPEIMLREMIRSVQRQLYPNWELCIADDGSSQPHVKRILEASAAKDRRIKLHLGPENKGVSHASNRALEMATGEFVVLLDHDDILEEQALFRVAESVLDENPDMTYSDEVMVTPDAAAVRHYAYRPAFSPEFLRAHPYFVHLLGFRTQLLRDIGGFDEKLKISQDYDLILRATERAQTVVHIPEILYRWRMRGDSAGQQRMHEVMETSKTVLQRHLERCGENGKVDDGVGFNLFDVRYALGGDLRVAIIIPTKNHGDLVRQCIESIRATVSEVEYDIVVVDHASDDADTLAYLTSISPEVRVLRYTPPAFNFSAINNFAVSRLDGDYSHYLFCNNDIEAIQPGWLARMLELGQHPSVGIVGAKLLYPDRITLQHAGVCVGTYGCAEHYGKFLRLPENRFHFGFSEMLVSNHEVGAVTAACMLIRKEAFEELYGFDEAFAVGFGDVDLCIRAGERGYRVLFCSYAELLHHESYTRGKSTGDPHPEDSALFRSKWRELLQVGDPYFNPGLSIESTTWQMKQPLNCGFGIRRRIVRRDRKSGKENVSFSTAAGGE